MFGSLLTVTDTDLLLLLAAALGVARDQRPHVRRAARVFAAFIRQALIARIAHVPRPGELAGHGVVGAQDARRIADLEAAL